MATTTLPATAEDAEQRFYARYADQIGGQSLNDVRRYLGRNVLTPRTVDDWLTLAAEVRDHTPPAPAPVCRSCSPEQPPTASVPLTFTFTVQARIGDATGPLAISGGTLRDVAAVVKLLPQTPGVDLVSSGEWRTTPDGRPICPKHGVPMKLREKQGDSWWSHAVEGPDGAVCYCKGHPGPDSPGWEV